MSAKAVFAGAFGLLVAVTLILPSLPPGEFLYELLEMPHISQSIIGISVSTLVYGFINGFLWGLVAAAVYGLSRRISRSRRLPPMPVARRLPTPPPQPVRADPRVEKIPPSFTVRKDWRIRNETEHDVETIEGVGPVRGQLLRNAGIRTVDDLLVVGATRRGRQRLANQVGVAYTTMLRWVYRGDLLRVRGIGKQYSSLLEAAGVATVTDLSTRNPRYLWQTLRNVNRRRSLVRRTPPRKTVEVWVHNAQRLEPIVK